jgi:hypothetical protein
MERAAIVTIDFCDSRPTDRFFNKRWQWTEFTAVKMPQDLHHKLAPGQYSGTKSSATAQQLPLSLDGMGTGASARSKKIKRKIAKSSPKTNAPVIGRHNFGRLFHSWLPLLLPLVLNSLSAAPRRQSSCEKGPPHSTSPTFLVSGARIVVAASFGCAHFVLMHSRAREFWAIIDLCRVVFSDTLVNFYAED